MHSVAPGLLQLIVLKNARRDIRSSGAGVTGGPEPPDRGPEWSSYLCVDSIHSQPLNHLSEPRTFIR
ncbi:hypothetical protein LEMLEM_LOCUS14719 [Lemmus lemmus]